jgi:hypothetical protein
MNQAEVTDFLNALSPVKNKLVSALRNVIRRTVLDAEESVLWGGLSYHRPQVGGRVKGAVCQIVVKGDSVRLDFIHGIRLADPCELLQGDRVSKRFVPIETVADAERPEITALIQEAAALDPTAWIEHRRIHARAEAGDGTSGRRKLIWLSAMGEGDHTLSWPNQNSGGRRITIGTSARPAARSITVTGTNAGAAAGRDTASLSRRAISCRQK